MKNGSTVRSPHPLVSPAGETTHPPSTQNCIHETIGTDLHRPPSLSGLHTTLSVHRVPEGDRHGFFLRIFDCVLWRAAASVFLKILLDKQFVYYKFSVTFDIKYVSILSLFLSYWHSISLSGHRIGFQLVQQCVHRMNRITRLTELIICVKEV